MALRAVAASLVVGLVVLAPTALSPSGARTASACLYTVTESTRERIADSLEYADVIAVAEVTSERQTVFNPSDPGDSGIFESKVRLLAVLRGTPPAAELTLPYLNDNCPGGGARLREGERALLFLHQTAYEFTAAGPNLVWALTMQGGKVLLRPDGSALMEDVGRKPDELGPSETVIRQVGELAGASELEIQAALAVAVSDKSAAGSWRVAVIAALGLVALALGWRWLARRPRTP